MEDRFIGKRIGRVVVLKQIGVKKKRKAYECLCSCGKKDILSSDQLSRNKNPGCKKCSRRIKFTDLKGQRFNKLVVIKEDVSYKGNGVKWHCLCDCGNKTVVLSGSLKNGHTKSCSCLQKEKVSKIKVNLTGQKFGKLTVIKKEPENAKWLCKCECGNEVITRSTSLYSGATKSCGCIRIEMHTGPNSRFWKGGITLINRGIKKSSKYWKWVRYVKKRDQYTCQCCSLQAISKKLHAHHIRNFADNIDVAFDTNNGITLCEGCHKKFHAVYGKIKTDNKQLTEFIKNEKIKNKT
jgi:hypothetical protein